MRLALACMLAFAVLSATTAAADPAQLASDRAAQAAKVYAALTAVSSPAATTDEDRYRWSVRWLDAELDAHPTTAAKAFADHAKRMADLEARVKAGYDKGFASSLDRDAATYYRLEADLWVARGKK